MPSMEFDSPYMITTGTVTTITSEGNAHKKKTKAGYRHSMLPQLQRLNPAGRQPSKTEGDAMSQGLGGLKLFDHLLAPDQRHSKANAKYWNRTRSQSPATSSHRRSSTEGSSSQGLDEQSVASSMTSSPSMTKEEFEALPPTIRRKYFSTLERLRFAQDSDIVDTLYYSFDNLSEHQNPGSDSGADTAVSLRPTLKPRLVSESSTASTCAQKSRSPLARLYSASADQESASFSQSPRESVILDATDESLIKIGKRRPPVRKPFGNLYRPASADHIGSKMHSQASTNAWMDGRIKATEDSIYDSFRWLEEDEELDLRLALDDYHYNLRQDVDAQRKSRSSSFRRHLSISKLPFRPSSTLSRPGTKDGNATSPFNNSVTSLPQTSGHIRRRSRALSLVSPNKQPASPEPAAHSPSMDPASYYQDPETRLKLRAYLASPHKFDEALEFGFPSIEQQTQEKTEQSLPKRSDSLPHQPEIGGLHRMQTLPEERRCSVYSDSVSTAEPDSPRTPDTLEKPSLVASARPSQDQESVSKVDYAQAPASSREMTLRMTLTRPDLRANETQIYGWQQKKRPSTQGEARSPTKLSHEVDFKDSIEKQLAAIDQENLASNENSSVKRFWNRVLRS